MCIRDRSSSRTVFLFSRPPPLRGPHGKELYGLKGLSPKQNEHVRLGTLLATRCAEMATLCDDLGIPWIVEQPLIREGRVSAFHRPEWIRVRKRPGVFEVDLDQCMYADLPPRPDRKTYRKGTTLIGNLDLRGLLRTCNCPSRMWTIHTGSSFTTSSGTVVQAPPGRRYRAPHPPLLGRVEAVPVGESAPSGYSRGFLTKETAHYPAELNWQLVALLGLGCSQRDGQPVRGSEPALVLGKTKSAPDHAGRPPEERTRRALDAQPPVERPLAGRARKEAPRTGRLGGERFG